MICWPSVPCRLYMKAKAPATSGRYWYGWVGDAGRPGPSCRGCPRRRSRPDSGRRRSDRGPTRTTWKLMLKPYSELACPTHWSMATPAKLDPCDCIWGKAEAGCDADQQRPATTASTEGEQPDRRRERDAAGADARLISRIGHGHSPESSRRWGWRRSSSVGPASTMRPGWFSAARKKAHSWDTRWACCMLWVTMTTVTSSAISAIVCSIRAVEVGSRAEHGSSMRSTRGSTARARAMHRRCCWPPDRAPPRSRNRFLTSFHRPALVSDASTSVVAVADRHMRRT